MTERNTTTGLPHTPLVTNVSIRVTALENTDDGYLLQVAGIPHEPVEPLRFECLGETPRVELYGRLWQMALRIPDYANVHCTVLGKVVRWQRWPYTHRAGAFMLFAEKLEYRLDTDSRLDFQEDRIARAG